MATAANRSAPTAKKTGYMTLRATSGVWTASCSRLSVSSSVISSTPSWGKQT